MDNNINLDQTLREKLKDIEDNLFVSDMNGDEFFVEENGLDYLLTFCENSFYMITGKLENGEHCIYPVINCNDLFWWACADYEAFSYKDVEDLYLASKEKWGIDKWACKKRGMRPQHPIENDMKKDSVWDKEMEALPVRGNTG
jgi:hypothetical protein